jgi:murein DD-endopeptidase MepM/ murein hydrolase activator NlpD
VRHSSFRAAVVRSLSLLLLVLLPPVVLGVALPVRASAQPPPAVITYRPPVAAAVVDPFRPPRTRYGPGNRGLEYDTVPGTRVSAAAAGTVVFAGAVAGRLHVTIRHADGIRTTYSYLASIAAASGQRVEQGSLVGVAGDTFHFGARIGDAYVDPEVLFGAGPAEVVLVPDGGPFPQRPPPALAQWVAPRAVPRVVLDATEVFAGWQARRHHCTAPGVGVPPPPPGRRVAILVGGLGSSSGEAAVAALDARRLGYVAGDVVRFSYRGGRVPGTGRAVQGLAEHDYVAADTLGDLDTAGGLLAELIEAVVAQVPGARVDLIGHSLGGLVARLAVDRLGRRSDGLVDRLGLVVTLGTPHHGVDLATVVGVVRSMPGGDAVLEELREALGLEIPGDAPVVAQLAESSPLMRHLARAGPPRVPVVSIAARGDPVVAAPRARLAGATNVVVPVEGLISDHRRLPASPGATREIGLALAGLPPTCEGLLDALADAVVGPAIGWAESGFGLVPGGGSAW